VRGEFRVSTCQRVETPGCSGNSNWRGRSGCR
jgi:hypothetical protein